MFIFSDRYTTHSIDDPVNIFSAVAYGNLVFQPPQISDCG